MICRHFGVCGGCTAQDVAYDQQLQQKAATLRSKLGLDRDRPILAGAPLILPMPTGPDAMPWGFRSKVAFTFGPGLRGRGLVMGHYARGSQDIVPVDECPVHSPRANRIAFELRDHLTRAQLPAAGPAGRGIVRHVLVRVTADQTEAVAMLVVTRNDRALRAPVRAWLASPDRPDGLLLNINDRPGPFMIGSRTIPIAGREHVRERLHGHSFVVSPAAFFQTNPRGAEALQSMVLAAIGPARQVLDLYAGSGLFTVPIAAAGAQVTAVEDNRQALDDARRNLRLNRVAAGRVRLLGARVEAALAAAGRQPWDAVVLDPPRSGCAPAVLAAVFGRIAAPRVVYVSCNPDALASELPTILASRYRIERLQAVDMFPHTDHIEAVVELARGEVA
jgi:23S rRNA (uracil1939-C5)-methyltransferase